MQLAGQAPQGDNRQRKSSPLQTRVIFVTRHSSAPRSTSNASAASQRLGRLPREFTLWYITHCKKRGTLQPESEETFAAPSRRTRAEALHAPSTCPIAHNQAPRPARLRRHPTCTASPTCANFRRHPALMCRHPKPEDQPAYQAYYWLQRFQPPRPAASRCTDRS